MSSLQNLQKTYFFYSRFWFIQKKVLPLHRISEITPKQTTKSLTTKIMKK